MSGPDADQAAALEVARALIQAGIPVFAAPPDLDEVGNWRPSGGHQGSGYWLPSGWQRTVPTEHVLDGAPFPPWDRAAWRPGYALAAVMGHGLDAVDIDPRNGGDASLASLNGCLPRTIGWQATPSGGRHLLVTALEVGSRDAVLPGLDLKGGRPDGTGRGFVWIAPTVKVSKATGEIGAYRWGEVPNFARREGDTSGSALADRVRALLAPSGPSKGDGTPSGPGSGSVPYSTSQAEAFIGRALDSVSSANTGERNLRVNAASCTIYHFVPAFLTAEQAVGRIEAALPPGYDDPEWRKVVTGLRPPRDGWKAYLDESALPPGQALVEGAASNSSAGQPNGGPVVIPEAVHTSLDQEYLTFTQLVDLPTPDPMIDGILTRHAVAILRGRDASFKTFVALDWALCVATGREWLGRAVEPGRVLYVAGEGAYGLRERGTAWQQAWRTTIGSDFVVRKSAVNLYRGGAPLEHLLQLVEAYGFSLVVVDTLRRASGGADGNSSDMGTVVDNIDRIRRATAGGSVLVVAHTDKGDNDTRGYSGIEDDSDIVWHAKRGESLDLVLSNTKMKDGPESYDIPLMMKQCGGSLVVEGTSPLALTDLSGFAFKVHAALYEYEHIGVTGSMLAEAIGHNKGSVHRALNRLVGDGYVTKNGHLYKPSGRPWTDGPGVPGVAS